MLIEVKSSELISSEEWEVNGTTVRGEVGVIRDVGIKYDSDHKLFYIDMTIDFINGATQNAIIYLEKGDAYETISKLFELFNYPDKLERMNKQPITCLIHGHYIKGLVKGFKTMLFYKLGDEE